MLYVISSYCHMFRINAHFDVNKKLDNLTKCKKTKKLLAKQKGAIAKSSHKSESRWMGHKIVSVCKKNVCDLSANNV